MITKQKLLRAHHHKETCNIFQQQRESFQRQGELVSGLISSTMDEVVLVALGVEEKTGRIREKKSSSSLYMSCYLQ